MTDTYRVRPAALDDLPAIHDLISSAAAWLRDYKDTDQWAAAWPDKHARDARVKQGIEDGLTWMVEDAQGVAATVTCREHGNDMLWTTEELAEPAAYVSRLIVSRKRSGLGIGAALIDWAGLLGMRDWGAESIRIDVWTTNFALHDYYKGQHFEHLRTVSFPDPWDYPSAALFQKPMAEVETAAAARFELAREACLTGES
jgi:ribosomal protein S18 acetylase RimI-like enzyme